MQSRKHISEEFLNQPFKDLKKLLKKKDRAPERKTERPLHDEDVFRDAMKGVEEIREFRDISVPRKKAAVRGMKKISSDKEALQELEEIICRKRPVHLPDTQEYVEWIDPGYHDGILKKLHRGDYAVQDCLDLHGSVLEDGREQVDEFFRESLKKGYRCLKIIHGRGLRSLNGPVMKQAVVRWILGRYRKHIIAFVTARQCDGGLGALYVLLK